LPVEGLAGAAVKFGGDGVEVGLAVDGEVGACGEVLAEKSIGVVVAAALPGCVRVAEEDRDGGFEGEVGVVGHVSTLVMRHGPPQDPGKSLYAFSQQECNAFGVAVVGDFLQQDETSAAFDQGQDVCGSAGTENAVGLPVTGHAPGRRPRPVGR
jgi:hypothetical protein